MNTATQIQELLNHIWGIMLIFPLFGVLVVVSYYYPKNGVSAAAVVFFRLMYALALSEFIMFISERAPKNG